MTKKYLFISNSGNLTLAQKESKEPITLGNVRLPSVKAAIELGYEVYVGVNRTHAESLECANGYDVKFYNQNIYRNVFDIIENYKAFANLMKLIKSKNIDVIHCNTPLGGVLGRICGKIAGVPKIIYTAHGFHFYEGAPLLRNILFKTVESWLAKYTDVLITMNHEDFEAAKKFKLRNNGKVYFVSGVGINTENSEKSVDKDIVRKKLSISNEAIVLISMGDLIDRKNYKTSIEAIAKSNNKKIQYLICGKGKNLKGLKKLVEKRGLENQVHFLGHRNDIGQLLSIANIFIMSSYQEGLPRSTMEAMAAGLPCIVSKVRGNTDLIQEGIGGFLREPNDSEGFSEAINLLAEDIKMREKMSGFNLERIKKYDVSNIKKEIKKIYMSEL